MISKRARYALHGVGFLAYKHGGQPLAFNEILRYLKEYSQQLTLSPGYIAKIFQDLSRAGIVQSALGRKGGYTLARSPEQVKVVEVVTAVDGTHAESCCLLAVGDCTNRETCGVHQIICDAQRSFYDFLSSETAASLAEKMFEKRAPMSLNHTACVAEKSAAAAGE